MPGVTHFRLDNEAEHKISAFQQKNGIETKSQALRMLLALAFREADDINTAWARQAFREGMILGQTHLKKRLREAVDHALGEFEG